MKIKLLAPLLGLALSLAFYGCFSVGHEMNMAQTQQIQKGVTTRAQMEGLFGKPMSATTLSNGTTSAMWFYSEANSSARNFIPLVNVLSTKVDTKSQVLSVTFDGQGKVSDYTFTEGGAPVKGGLLK